MNTTKQAMAMAMMTGIAIAAVAPAPRPETHRQEREREEPRHGAWATPSTTRKKVKGERANAGSLPRGRGQRKKRRG